MSSKNKNEKQSIDDITELNTDSLLKDAKEKYSKKYSDQMAQLIEDNLRLERALKFVRTHIKRVAEGDILAIEEYLESRKKLSEE